MKVLHELILFKFFLCFRCIHGKISYNTLSVGLSRATQHTPKIINKVCMLIADEGPCRADIQMYRFTPELMNCTLFSWGGCQGNGNRFDTYQECMTTCVSSGATRPARPTYCSLRFDYGFCFGEIRRWYYDAKWNVCRETLYSGCGGNQNHFYTEEECDSVCRFGRGQLNQTKDPRKKTKILIVNPEDSSSHRGGHKQNVTTQAPCLFNMTSEPI